jgi:DNA-binding PadR family transcriptional regulator
MAATLRSRHKDSAFKVNSGSLYDTVEALARESWIEPVETQRDGRRPERTVYAFTALGQDEFLGWISELIRTPVPEYPPGSARSWSSAVPSHPVSAGN